MSDTAELGTNVPELVFDDLKIADDFAAPVEMVVRTNAILAQKGAGKSYCASVLAEEMMKAGQPIIYLDPLGSAYGLGSSADGLSPGYPVVIFGGEHAHVPISEDMGEKIARLIISQRFSAILDVSEMMDSEQRRFITAFVSTLYRVNRESIHFFIDEADVFAPQRPQKGDEKMLHAINNLVRRGRFHGVGVTMISQRAAVIHKDILNMIDTLIVLRTIAPRDRDAVKEWIEAKSTGAERQEFIETLPSLDTGEAWIWSPEFLKCFVRVHIRQRETFDSSKTPQVGQKAFAPVASAPVDIGAILEALQMEIPDDDRSEEVAALRRQVNELQVQLAARKTEVRYMPVLNENALEIIRRAGYELAKNFQDSFEQISEQVADISQVKLPQVTNPEFLQSLEPYVPEIPAVITPIQFELPITEYPETDGEVVALSGKITPAVKRVLDSIAMFHPDSVSRHQVAILSTLAPSGRSYSNYLSILTTEGLIIKDGFSLLALTAKGRQFYDKLPAKLKPHEIEGRWFAKFTPAIQGLLHELWSIYPEYMTREQLATTRFGLDAKSRSFSNYMSELRTNGLLEEYQKISVRAHPSLFLEG